ncbi:MAG: hypothetical protein JWO03_1284 [Bacteroidetes bacterium]|nr:hypothetical protein [Bacteroidota bacterium]
MAGTSPFHDRLQDLRDAAAYDPTVSFTAKNERALADKLILSFPYSRKKLYDNMAAGVISVFNDYPMRKDKAYAQSDLSGLIKNLKTGLPRKAPLYIRAGKSRTKYKVTVDETIRKWQRGKAVFGVTDLHFRGTKFYDMVDAESLSYFNLLCDCPENVSFLEMLTLVISSKGIFSDSHSDDGDGSNHCFVGKKVWLAWDRAEGQKKGLEDCTYDNVMDQAAFDMDAFLSLRSSRWFVISENETLFMPGNFSHKVITIESYIGFGSFYVTMPGYLNTIKRWTLRDTSDVKGDFIKIMNKTVLSKLKRLRSAQQRKQDELGLHYLKDALGSWSQDLAKPDVKRLSSNAVFTEFLNTATELLVK